MDLDENGQQADVVEVDVSRGIVHFDLECNTMH